MYGNRYGSDKGEEGGLSVPAFWETGDLTAVYLPLNAFSKKQTFVPLAAKSDACLKSG